MGWGLLWVGGMSRVELGARQKILVNNGDVRTVFFTMSDEWASKSQYLFSISSSL